VGNVSPLLLSIGMSFAIVIIAILIGMALAAGQVGMCYEALKGQTSLRTLFYVVKVRGLAAIEATILVFLAVMSPFVVFSIAAYMSFSTEFLIGIILFSLGIFISFIISIHVSLYLQALVISGQGPTYSIKTSSTVVKHYFWDLFLLFVFYILFSFLIGLLPYIGILITLLLILPLMNISLVKFYVDRTSTTLPSPEKIEETPPQT